MTTIPEKAKPTSSKKGKNAKFSILIAKPSFPRNSSKRIK